MAKRDDTLARMIASGYGIAAYCDARGCERGDLGLDIYDLALAFGSRTPLQWPLRWPITCAACGSNQIGYRVAPEVLPIETAKITPPRNYRASRTDEERAALQVLFPRVWL